jgi:hypothetical protein
MRRGASREGEYDLREGAFEVDLAIFEACSVHDTLDVVGLVKEHHLAILPTNLEGVDDSWCIM